MILHYMGVGVEEDVEPKKGCFTCYYGDRTDRHECNVCAQAWQASGMTRYIGWKTLEESC